MQKNKIKKLISILAIVVISILCFRIHVEVEAESNSQMRTVISRNSPLKASKVKIQLRASGVPLSLAEVELYSYQ